MNQLKQGVMRFLRDEEGATMIEYALLGALISIIAIASLTAIGGNVNQIYQAICQALAGTNAGNTTCP